MQLKHYRFLPGVEMLMVPEFLKLLFKLYHLDSESQIFP